MKEKSRSQDGEKLRPIKPGEVIRETPNFRVVTDYKPGLEGKRKGERFYIEPLSESGIATLMYAAAAHNIYNFDHRPVHGIRRDGVSVVPCLRADYIWENAVVLVRGDVRIPKKDEDSVPSPDRMEEVIAKGITIYTFQDDIPLGHQIKNPVARKLRVLQKTYKDEIPRDTVHSSDPDSYYKARKGWWRKVLLWIDVGIKTTEFKNPALLNKIREFKQDYAESDFFDTTERRTTKKDIRRANEILDEIWYVYGNR